MNASLTILKDRSSAAEGNSAFAAPAYAYSLDPAPPADATRDVSDEWDFMMDQEYMKGDVTEALFLRATAYDSYPVARGHGLYREVEYEYDVHTFIGLTVESREEIRFIDRPEVERIFGADWIRDREAAIDGERS